MRLEDAFAYLHDAEVRRLSHEPGAAGLSTAKLELRVHPDCGHPPWNDQTVTILFLDVLLWRSTLWGHALGRETFDRGHPRISASAQQLLATLGAPTERHLLSLGFHSSSEIEVVCEDIEVVLHP